MSVIATSKVVGAPAECVVARERHLQHRQAVAGRRARDAGQYLALDALEHPGPAAAARTLRLDLQRHVHGHQRHPAGGIRIDGVRGRARCSARAGAGVELAVAVPPTPSAPSSAALNKASTDRNWRTASALV